MSHRADPSFLPELNRYGAVNIESCFNCGNCSAVCPLSSEQETFPRRMIRYAQIGMKEELLSSKELWMCYYCGQCTETCPRQAEPGEFMAAARRYAIARYDRLGLARLLYTSPLFTALFLIALAFVVGLVIYSVHGPMPGDTLRLFEFIPAEAVHNLGVIAGVVIAALTLWGAGSMLVQIGREIGPMRGVRFNWLAAAWEAFGLEALGQRRYRQDCEMYTEKKPWYVQKWFIHAAMLWGFLALLAATALDFLLALLGIKATGTWVPIWYPVRMLGTVGGILLVYGTTMAIVRRLRKSDEASTHSTPSDWAFLILLWLAGMTGFVLEIAVYLGQPYAWGYWMLPVHMVVAAELLILLPYTKFAHAVYRTLALYVHALKPLAEPEAAAAAAD
jgi:ferredoxin/nitrate reductase gamma subunit